MQFVHPEILWALLALTIPVIIHLFHFRRFKKVYFTNVKFLKEIKDEKSARRRLRNLLILLFRLLAYSAIIFAFAQPFISEDKTAKKGLNNVSIFIDNSFSMMAASEDVPLLAKAKRKAEEIISAYGPADQFQILSHELSSSQIRWINKDNTLDAIERIELNPEVTPIQTVWERQSLSRPGSGNHIVYIISDFQKSSSAFNTTLDSLTELNLIPLQSVKENNVSIDSVWFESVVPAMNQNNTLYVKIRNHSDETIEDLRINLIHNGQNRPEGTLNIDPKSTNIDTMNLLVSQAGWQEIQVQIEDYPIQFDDRYYLSLNVKQTVEVLNIKNQTGPKYIEAVFNSLNNFRLQTVNPSSIQYDQFKAYDLIILSDLVDISSGLSSALSSYIRDGGNVLIFPDRNANIDNYNALFKSLGVNNFENWLDQEEEVFSINTSEFVFENVFNSVDRNLKLPVSKGYFKFSNYSRLSGEYLLRFRNGDHYFSKYPRDKGHLFVSASPLNPDYNSLVLNAEIFVPLLYKAAYASSQSETKSFTIGRDNNTLVSSANRTEDFVYKMKSKEEFIPGQTNMGDKTLLSFNNLISEDGFYDVTLDSELIKKLAFNYDRIESELEYYSIDELKANYPDQTKIFDNAMSTDLGILVKEKDKGTLLWKWCLILALISLAIETLLLRFWKI